MNPQRILPFLFPVLLHAGWEGQMDLNAYQGDTPAPGLLQDEDGGFLQARLSLRARLRHGESWTLGLLARADRGVDPGRAPDGDFRLDAYWLRYAPPGSTLRLDAGKLPTIFGGWVSRQDSPQNPFLLPPLPYDRVTAYTGPETGLTRQAFLDRRDQADNKTTWRPLVWAPAYAHGLMAQRTSGPFDFAAEIRDAALSSPPEDWEEPQDFGDPTFIGRVGWRANAALQFGASVGRGPHESTLGLEATYAKGRLQLWGECVGARMDVPELGGVSSLGFTLEAKQKLDAKHFLGLRAGAQVFERIEGDGGERVPWDRDTFRAEASLGRRIDRNQDVKVQASHTLESGASANEGTLWVLGWSARF